MKPGRNVKPKVQLKRRIKRRRSCSYCVDQIYTLDYKKVELFKRFVTERKKIYPRRNSRLCAKHQRMLASAIKRARYIGLIATHVD